MEKNKKYSQDLICIKIENYLIELNIVYTSFMCYTKI